MRNTEHCIPPNVAVLGLFPACRCPCKSPSQSVLINSVLKLVNNCALIGQGPKPIDLTVGFDDGENIDGDIFRDDFSVKVF